jgi:hypothetical protein
MARKGGAPENMRPFEKGDSRINRKGRPPILPELKEAVSKVLGKEYGSETGLDKVLTSLFNRALKGDVRAAQEILDRGFGKSPQKINTNITDNSDTGLENLSFEELYRLKYGKKKKKKT